ncbi:MAG TPA: hypothetical protein VFY54_18525 [Rubrobacter sp.]|nr:hypothetical protein [Rubrobacter sp.]
MTFSMSSFASRNPLIALSAIGAPKLKVSLIHHTHAREKAPDGREGLSALVLRTTGDEQLAFCIIKGQAASLLVSLHPLDVSENITK